jgi:uncharacterized protein (DUF2236 family)
MRCCSSWRIPGSLPRSPSTRARWTTRSVALSNIRCCLHDDTLDQALAAARRVHRRHIAIYGCLPEDAGPFFAGSGYCANDIETLTWVHATLIDTALIAHDLVLPPLSTEERERYYAERQLFAELFGIPRQSLPDN